MKKLAIVASSVALAAMPVVGVFAATGDGVTSTDNGSADSFTDEINVTINTACTFVRQDYTNGGVQGNASHKNGAGTWAGDVLSKTVANSSLTDLGSSQFKVVCNNTAGYSITVTTTGLTGQLPATGTRNSIPNNSTYTNAVSGWSPVFNGNKLVDGDTVKTVAAPTDNDTFEVSYSVGVSSTQQADTYSGSAQYTFAQL